MNTVQATKNSVTAESGSIWTPIVNHELPVGIQGMEDANGCKPRCSALAAFAKTTMLPAQERNAAPTAIKILSPFLRFVNKMMRKKASKGGKGMSQMSVSTVIKFLADYLKNPSIIPQF